MHNDELLVQNNRDVPVEVYLNMSPVDKKLGTIAPFQSAMMTIPGWVGREQGDLDVFAIPEGQIALKGRAELSDGGPYFSLVIPPAGDQKVRMQAPSLASLLYPPTIVTTTFTDDED